MAICIDCRKEIKIGICSNCYNKDMNKVFDNDKKIKKDIINTLKFYADDGLYSTNDDLGRYARELLSNLQ